MLAKRVKPVFRFYQRSLSGLTACHTRNRLRLSRFLGSQIEPCSGCAVLSLSKGPISVLFAEMSSFRPPLDLFTDIGTAQEGVVALTTGAPGLKNLHKVGGVIAQGTRNLLGSGPIEPTVLQYGPRQGSPRFRQQLAKFLSAGYNDTVDSEKLLLTSGATYGLHLTGSILLEKGATVFVEDPTYFIAINILKADLGFNVVAVPTDPNGVDTDALDRMLTEEKAKSTVQTSEKKPFWSMVYLIPTYNNPRGMCYPPEKNRKLVELARKHDVLLFCDDVYNLLHFDPKTVAPPRLVSYDKPTDAGFKGNVLSNGSFAKIMGPGLRMGWIEAEERILKLLWNSNINWSAGAANQFMSEVVASCLELGITQEYIKGLNAEYAQVVAHVNKVFEENLPAGVTFSRPAGGYFYWIEMPPNAKSTEVAKIAYDKFKVRVLPGQNCSPTGKFQNCLRASFSHYEEDILVDGIKKLCEAITIHLASSSL